MISNKILSAPQGGFFVLVSPIRTPPKQIPFARGGFVFPPLQVGEVSDAGIQIAIGRRGFGTGKGIASNHFLSTFIRLNKKGTHSAQEYISGINAGNRMMLAKAITLCESTLPTHRTLAIEVLKLCLPQSGNSIRVGITGVPGVGKSTFIESLGTYLTGLGHKVAVLAVDPSSARTGGSILGDKTRMEALSVNPNAFIRPTPSSGNLGGVGARTRECIILCEAAGYDVILIETVGVGQSETEVKSMADFFLLLMLAGAGDELQGIKRGIMEMADGAAINKADGDNLTKAKTARAEYARALHLFPPDDAGWSPQVAICSAINNKGIDTVWDMVVKHKEMLVAKNLFEQRRSLQRLNWFDNMLGQSLLEAFNNQPTIQNKLPEIKKAILAGQMIPSEATDTLIKSFINK